MDEWQDGYTLGWITGFVGAIAALYLVNRYFPDLLAQHRTIVIRAEGNHAGPDSPEGMARRDETRTDA